MSETITKWTEVTFNLAYLAAVWALVVAMVRRRSAVATEHRRVAQLVAWAFALLALGDTGHVGFRVLGYALGDLDLSMTAWGMEIGLVGLGAMTTAFTVTLFYVLILFAWRTRFDRAFGWFEYSLLVTATLRLGLMLLPANNWNSTVPPQPWSTVRNLPLIVQGLGVAYLTMRDAQRNGDTTFIWIGVMILVSYACYIPVVLFVQRAPMLGMLMIPKTVAYLVIGCLSYRDLFRERTSPLQPHGVAGGGVAQ